MKNKQNLRAKHFKGAPKLSVKLSNHPHITYLLVPCAIARFARVKSWI